MFVQHFGLLLYCIASVQAWGRHESRTWTVTTGESIQRAIDRASSGDTIIVNPGTYAEQLLIKKNRLSLIGRGAVLVPPADAAGNDCSEFCGPGTEAGICIAGSGITADPFVGEHQKIRSVRHPVMDVLIQGLQVKGFAGGPSVLIIGGKDVILNRNEINGGLNSLYGILSAGSLDTVMSRNVIRGLEDLSTFNFVAACNDNLKGASVFDNDLAGYFIGLCIQTSSSSFCNNKISNACAGAYVDPFISNVKLENNKIASSYPSCGSFGAWGIYVSGANKTQISNNHIKSIANSNGPSAAINIQDDDCSQPSLACVSNGGVPSIGNGNKVWKNSFRNNTLDLRLRSIGRGNEFRKNECKTSDPAGLCNRRRTVGEIGDIA